MAEVGADRCPGKAAFFFVMPALFCGNSHPVSQVAVVAKGLAAEAKALNDLLVALFGFLFEVVQKLAALGDHLEQTTAG
jgi:hypothetical protein